jgi:hypothetical protein
MKAAQIIMLANGFAARLQDRAPRVSCAGKKERWMPDQVGHDNKKGFCRRFRESEF